jgi:hypothetical protein
MPDQKARKKAVSRHLSLAGAARTVLGQDADSSTGLLNGLHGVLDLVQAPWETHKRESGTGKRETRRDSSHGDLRIGYETNTPRHPRYAPSGEKMVVRES